MEHTTVLQAFFSTFDIQSQIIVVRDGDGERFKKNFSGSIF